MHHFHRLDGALACEETPLADLAGAFGTPLYVYSTATLTRHYRVLADAFAGQRALIAYSVKANSNLAVIATLARLGAGADVVSAGELLRAVKAGIAPQKIVFSGVGKRDDELDAALAVGIHQFNVESEPELLRLAARAQAANLVAPIAFRVNPDVSAGGHAKISTGKAEDKFGIAWAAAPRLYALAASLPGVAPVAVDVHIGSQIGELQPFAAAFGKVLGLVEDLRRSGLAISRADLGGGLGIPYRDGDAPAHPDEYARMIADLTRGRDLEIILEPGRVIVGNAGVLLTRIIDVKHGESKTHVIVDAAMNDLMRPALYDAHHEIVPVRERAGAPQLCDIVGPICETTDRFAADRWLAPVEAGDLLAILSAGAYGAVMASSYNSRPLVAEAQVDGARFALTRRRPSLEALLADEIADPWIR